MLLRLSPDQISKIWYQIRSQILSTIVPCPIDPQEAAISILHQLLSGNMQMWAAIDGDAAQLGERVVDHIFGFVLTTMYVDPILKKKNLLIYSIFSEHLVPDELWYTGLRSLEEFQRSEQCERMIAFTDHSNIKKLAGKLGFQELSFLYRG